MSMSRFRKTDGNHTNEESTVDARQDAHNQEILEEHQHLSQQSLPPQYKRNRKSKRGLVIVVILILVVVGAGGAFYVFGLSDSETTTPTPTPSVTETPMQPAQTVISDTTERYRSSRFLLSFDVPTDWEIKDTASSPALTATSPKVSIPTDNGSTNGIVVLSIQRKGTELPQFEAGNATAAAASEKIAYTDASASQRGETFISFLSYADSASAHNIDAVYITGDFGYEKDQAIPAVDIKKIDPNIFVEFFACDGGCDVPLAIAPSAWKDTQFGKKIEDILISLTIN